LQILIPIGATTYQLVIGLTREARIVVGRLGIREFPAGTYVYTGSVRRGLEARVRRHLAQSKRLHWHIDHLLACHDARVIELRFSAEPECVLNRRTDGEIIMRGFGASDCRAGCGAHFKRMG
jgi:Uri superfamily endonuclease